MKRIYIFLVVLCTASSHVMAIDVDQIRARNQALESHLTEVRVEQARAMLAGETANKNWRDQIVLLDQYASDIDMYYQANQTENKKLAINASQKIVIDLASKYSKRVYGGKPPKNEIDDPFIASFKEIYTTLKRMENRPKNHTVLSHRLDVQLEALNTLVNTATVSR